jgi:putative transcriptional regulator
MKSLREVADINKRNNLDIIRKHFNKTQTEMSNIFGITLQRYNNYEKQRRKLPVNIAKKVSDKFDLSLDAVFFEEELFNMLGNNENSA